jgi:Polyketide cyclase / dehydrase and lipid transport
MWSLGALCQFMANPENERFWNPDLLDVRRIGDGPVAPGAEWEARYKGMGVNRMMLAEYERPTRVVFETTGERMDMRLVFTFSPDGDGTRAQAHTEMHPKGVMRLLAPLMMPMVKRNFSKRPAQLKAGLAASQSTPPAQTPAE